VIADTERENPIRILIADDQSHARGGLVALLRTCHDFEIVGIAADGREALELAAIRGPEIVLMDMRMPVLDGLEATRRLKKAHPLVLVLVLTMFGHASAAARAEGATAGRLIRTLRELARQHRQRGETSP